MEDPEVRCGNKPSINQYPVDYGLNIYRGHVRSLSKIIAPIYLAHVASLNSSIHGRISHHHVPSINTPSVRNTLGKAMTHSLPWICYSAPNGILSKMRISLCHGRDEFYRS